MARNEFLLVVVGIVVVIDPVISLEAAKPVGKLRFCSTEGEQCFSYNSNSAFGPSNWSQVCQTDSCFHGVNQSPIHINPNEAERVCDLAIRPHYSDNPNVHGTLVNEGLHPSVEGITGAELSGVPGISEKFDLVAIHFHFRGGSEDRGTEHIVDNANYDAEMHMVHVRQSVTPGLASSRQSGLAVVAVFLDTSEGETNDELDIILDNVEHVREYRLRHCRELSGRTGNDGGCPRDVDGCTPDGCQEVEVEFHPDRLLPENREFFYYYGSLTTPPLTEAVSWNVMSHPIKITDEQLEFLQNLESRQDGIKIIDDGNVRPTQPQNGRKVFFNTCEDDD